DGVAGLGVEEVHALSIHHDLDLVAGPDPLALAARELLGPAVEQAAELEHDWNTMPMSRFLGDSVLTTRSPIFMVPLEMSSSPATVRRAVLLPHPEGPPGPGTRRRR